MYEIPRPTHPRAIRLTSRRVLPATADEVWRVIAEYPLDPQWRTGVTSMTCEPAGIVTPGSVTVEQMRFGGRTYRNVGEVVEVEPGRALRWRTTAGADADGSRTVEPVDGGACAVTLELTVRPTGFERLVAPLLARMLARNLARDLAALEQLVVGSRGVDQDRTITASP